MPRPPASLRPDPPRADAAGRFWCRADGGARPRFPQLSRVWRRLTAVHTIAVHTQTQKALAALVPGGVRACRRPARQVVGKNSSTHPRACRRPAGGGKKSLDASAHMSATDRSSRGRRSFNLVGAHPRAWQTQKALAALVPGGVRACRRPASGGKKSLGASAHMADTKDACDGGIRRRARMPATGRQRGEILRCTRVHVGARPQFPRLPQLQLCRHVSMRIAAFPARAY